MSVNNYGLERNLGAVDFDATRRRLVAALKDEGFGVLTEIDVQATLRAKLGVEHQPYLILGACNPQLAHRALQLEPGIGLLLPCNATLRQDEGGDVWVAVADPRAMFAVVGRDDMEPVVAMVEGKLRRVIESV